MTADQLQLREYRKGGLGLPVQKCPQCKFMITVSDFVRNRCGTLYLSRLCTTCQTRNRLAGRYPGRY